MSNLTVIFREVDEESSYNDSKVILVERNLDFFWKHFLQEGSVVTFPSNRDRFDLKGTYRILKTSEETNKVGIVKNMTVYLKPYEDLNKVAGFLSCETINPKDYCSALNY